MPTYKLTYFNFTGLGEPIRFLLHYGGVNFEDHRINYEEWPQWKSKMPMEQVPVIEIDGKVYYQTRAVSRYFAKKFGIYGSDELQALEIDTSVDDIEDYRSHITRYYIEKDPTNKAKLKAVALEKLVFFFNKFEERVKKNGGYFVGGKLTWADLHFSAICEVMSNVLEKDVTAGYPALKKVYDTVRSTPKIKAYLQKRPETIL